MTFSKEGGMAKVVRRHWESDKQSALAGRTS
jgi:hypothetical protein